MKRKKLLLPLLVFLLLLSLVACEQKDPEAEVAEKPEQKTAAEVPAAAEETPKKDKTEPIDYDVPEPLPEQIRMAGDFDSWDEVAIAFPRLTGEQLREPLHTDERVLIGGTLEIPRTILKGWPIAYIWDEGPNGFTSTMVVFDMEFLLTTDILCQVETALDVKDGVLDSESRGAVVTGPPVFASYPEFFEYVLEKSPHVDYDAIMTEDKGPMRIWKVEGTIVADVKSDTASDDMLSCWLELDDGRPVYFQFPFNYASTDAAVGDRIVGIGFSQGMNKEPSPSDPDTEVELPWMFIHYAKKIS